MFLPGLMLARALGAKGFASRGNVPLGLLRTHRARGCGGRTAPAGLGAPKLSARDSRVHGPGIPVSAVLMAGLPQSLLPRWRPVVQWAAILGGMVAGSALIVSRLLPAVGKPGNFAQVYDNIFTSMRSGTSSKPECLVPDVGTETQPGFRDCHLPVRMAFAGCPRFPSDQQRRFRQQNAVIVAVSAHPVALRLHHAGPGIVGPRVLPLVVAGALSGGFWMFLFQLLQWGPLYPNTLAYSLLPLALLVLVGLFKPGAKDSLDNVGLWSFLAIAVAALFLSQPNGVTALLAFSVPLIAAAWFSQIRARIRSKAGAGQSDWRSSGASRRLPLSLSSGRHCS